MDGEQLSAVTMEWKVLKERFFAGEPVDPVFEGIVKDFISFDVTLQDIFKKVEVFMKGGVKLQDELKKHFHVLLLCFPDPSSRIAELYVKMMQNVVSARLTNGNRCDSVEIPYRC